MPLLWMALKAITPSPPKGVPGPYPWPIVGQTFDLVKFANGKMHDYLVACFHKYGSIFAVPMLGTYMVMVSDADAIKELMTNTDSFVRGDMAWEAAKGYFDNVLPVMPSGAMWHRHRKLMQPAFGPIHLRQAVIASGDIVDKFTADWQSIMAKTGSKTVVVDMYKYMSAGALDIITKIAFSKDPGAVESISKGEHNKLGHMFEEIVAILQLRIFTPPALWWWSGLSSNSPRVTSVREQTQRFVKDVIAERREAMRRGEHDEKSKWEMDVLDRLLQSGLSEEEIIGESLGLFLAGHETTANSMSFIILCLCQHPDIMAKVVDEIDRVVAKLDGNITIENLFEFRYLDWVVKETQRYHTVLPFIARESAKPVTLMGHKFPAKIAFSMLLNNVHRNPKHWTDPDTFNPDRWALPPVPGSFVPFGEGPMMCIGQKMANIEMRVVVINILRRFTLELVPDQKLEFITTMTYGLKNGFKVKVTERKM
ncbi:cytochrome P450 [Entophlyctis helioformis]|nr:cytochrome P450 [Entophlyctis helioformis]